MPRRSQPSSASEEPKKAPPGKKIKKERFGFTIEKDIRLLRTALSINPWQLGEDKWTDVAKDLNENFKYDVTSRTTKDRIDRLIQQLKKQELKSKTGTEEQQSERGELLQQIIALVEEASASINKQFGAEESDSMDSCSGDKEVIEVEGPIVTVTEPQLAKPQQLRKERQEADKLRNDTVSEMKKNLALSPVRSRRSRNKFNEEELIWTKHEHDMRIEEMKQLLEEKKQECSFALENDRIRLEEAKLEIDKQKEARLVEETKRSHELAMVQLGMQKTMCELVNVLAKSLNKE